MAGPSYADAIARHAADPGSPPALVLPDRIVGYAEFAADVDACAAWLAARGCGPDGVVGVCVGDEVLHLVVTLALLAIGAPQVVLPTHEPPAAREELARRLAVRTLVVGETSDALPDRAYAEVSAAVLARERRRKASVRPGSRAGALVYYASSGTTGRPKIYSLTEDALIWRVARARETEAMGPGSRILALSSVEHSPSRHKRMFALHAGLTSVFVPESGAMRTGLAGACAEHGVTNVELNTLQVASLLAEEGGAAAVLPPQTSVYVAGSRVPAQMRRTFRSQHGRPLYVHYGAREIGRIAFNWPDGGDDELETLGPPVRWMDVEIVDADGVPVPRGEVGEIRLRSDHLACGYLDDPQATARAYRDGWFHPGDLVSLTGAGELRLHGRVDERMNLNSIKIYPSEIEQVIEALPGVRAAAAFAQPSPVHGDIPMVAVETLPGTTVDPEALLEAARERLGLRAPRRIVVVETLPRNSAGKILRTEVARMLAGGR